MNYVGTQWRSKKEPERTMTVLKDHGESYLQRFYCRTDTGERRTFYISVEGLQRRYEPVSETADVG